MDKIELKLYENFINIVGLQDYQKEVLQYLINDKNIIYKAPRQMGKTTIGNIWLLCSAIKYKNCNFFLISPTRRNSVSILKNIYILLEDFCDKNNVNYIKSFNRTTIHLTNGSSIAIHDIESNYVNHSFLTNENTDFIFIDELESVLEFNSNDTINNIFKFFNKSARVYCCSGLGFKTKHFEKLVNSLSYNFNWQYLSN